MTLCNMAIEGGARCGYVNPDQVTFDYLEGRPEAPSGEAWERAVQWWSALASDSDAHFDDEVRFDAMQVIAPTVTWGITPGQGIGVDETVPTPEQLDPLRSSDRGGGLPLHGPGPRLRHCRCSCGCVFHRQLHQRPSQ